jgi:hypothetical protein
VFVNQALLERNRTAGISECSSESDTTQGRAPAPEKPKSYYKMNYYKEKFFKIHFDRLSLLALLDK